jgi:hypothetical protein
LTRPPSTHILRTTRAPEHFSSPFFTKNLVAPYWLASRSSVHPVNASSSSILNFYILVSVLMYKFGKFCGISLSVVLWSFIYLIRNSLCIFLLFV